MSYLAESEKIRASQPNVNFLTSSERNTDKSHSISGCKPGNSSQVFDKNNKQINESSNAIFIKRNVYIKYDFPKCVFYENYDYPFKTSSEIRKEKKPVYNYLVAKEKVEELYEPEKETGGEIIKKYPRDTAYRFLANNISLRLAEIDLKDKKYDKEYSQKNCEKIKGKLRDLQKCSAYNVKKEIINEALDEVHGKFFPEEKIEGRNRLKKVVSSHYNDYSNILKALRYHLDNKETFIKTYVPERIDLDKILADKK
ncbi:hypothetical protein [Pantoea sp. Acro-807]|uniref:hypothetical protein n=1 Tax=Pantoea sp. Acro-807 TaxID=2608356 RepID=UPI00141A2E17|nr:hypothetical protein [Pantoea sp. Acro-807]NIE72342.1 hypothetical protein [Pantoea sp. Acro-807]